MCSIVDVLPLEITLNVLLFCDSVTLCSIALTNRIFYYLTCRDEIGDEILWRNIFLAELMQLQGDKRSENRFKGTIRKYLSQKKPPKKKSPIQFTDNDGNPVSLASVYRDNVDLTHIVVTGSGEHNCNILKWKSVYAGHMKAKIVVNVKLKLQDKNVNLVADSYVSKIRSKYPKLLQQLVESERYLLRMASDLDDVESLVEAKQYFETFGVPDNILSEPYYMRNAPLVYNFLKTTYPDRFYSILKNRAMHHFECTFLSYCARYELDFYKTVILDHLEMLKQDFMEQGLSEGDALESAKANVLGPTRWASGTRSCGPFYSALEFSYTDPENLANKFQFLDDLGANLGEVIKDPYGRRQEIIESACRAGNTEAICWLIGRGVPLSLNTFNPLLFLIGSDYPDKIQVIHSRFPDLSRKMISMVDRENRNVLHRLLSTQHTRIDEWRFLLSDIDPDLWTAPDSRGRTPFAYVIEEFLIMYQDIGAAHFTEDVLEEFKHRKQHLLLKRDIVALRNLLQNPLFSAQALVSLERFVARLEVYEIPEVE